MNNGLKKISKIKRLTALSILIAILAPTLVTATVILTYQYNVSSTYSVPYLYVSTGDNYNTANSLGLIYAKTATFSTSSGSTITYIPSGTVDLNVSSGVINEYLLNVLTVYNASTGIKGPVYAYINFSSIPTGVTVFIATAPLIYTGSTGQVSSTGTLYTLSSSSSSSSAISQKIQITSSSPSSPALYIGFEYAPNTGQTLSSFTLTVQFSVQ